MEKIRSIFFLVCFVILSAKSAIALEPPRVPETRPYWIHFEKEIVRWADLVRNPARYEAAVQDLQWSLSRIFAHSSKPFTSREWQNTSTFADRYSAIQLRDFILVTTYGLNSWYSDKTDRMVYDQVKSWAYSALITIIFSGRGSGMSPMMAQMTANRVLAAGEVYQDRKRARASVDLARRVVEDILSGVEPLNQLARKRKKTNEDTFLQMLQMATNPISTDCDEALE